MAITESNGESGRIKFANGLLGRYVPLRFGKNKSQVGLAFDKTVLL